MVGILILLFLVVPVSAQKTFYKADLSALSVSSPSKMYYFNKTRIKEGSLKGIKTQNFYVNTTVWEQADFRDSNLKGSSWIRSTCRACDFRGADLRDSIFFDSDFMFSKINSLTKFSIPQKRIDQLGFQYAN